MTNQTQNNTELNISLTVTEINFILALMSKAPYEQVEGLITKIRVQGQAGFAALQQAQALAGNQEEPPTEE